VRNKAENRPDSKISRTSQNLAQNWKKIAQCIPSIRLKVITTKLRWKLFLQDAELKFDWAIKCEPILGSLMLCPFQHIIFKRK